MARVKLKKSGKVIIFLTLLLIFIFFIFKYYENKKKLEANLIDFCMENVDISLVEDKYKNYILDNDFMYFVDTTQLVKVDSIKFMDFYTNAVDMKQMICLMYLTTSFEIPEEGRREISEMGLKDIVMLRVKNSKNDFEIVEQISFERYMVDYSVVDLNSDGISELHLQFAGCFSIHCNYETRVYELVNDKLNILWEKAAKYIDYSADKRDYYIFDEDWAYDEGRLAPHKYFISQYSYNGNAFKLKKKYHTIDKYGQGNFGSIDDILKKSLPVIFKRE